MPTLLSQDHKNKPSLSQESSVRDGGKMELSSLPDCTSQGNPLATLWQQSQTQSQPMTQQTTNTAQKPPSALSRSNLATPKSPSTSTRKTRKSIPTPPSTTTTKGSTSPKKTKKTKPKKLLLEEPQSR